MMNLCLMQNIQSMKYLITKYKIALLFTFLSSFVFAGHEKGIESFKGNAIFSAAASSTSNGLGDITNKDQAMYLDIIDHSYQKVRYASNWDSYLNLSEVSNELVLRFDDLQRQVFDGDWTMVVDYTIYFNADQSFDHYETGQLEITFNQAMNYIDQKRKVFTSFGSTGLAHEGLNPRVYIREATVTGTPVDQALLTSGDLDIYFDLELHTEKCYILQGEDLKAHVKDEQLYTFANTVDYDFAEVNWGYVEGAESYELEWLFVDLGVPTDESLTLGASLSDYPNFDYNFDNAFGITIQENSFKIPLNFPTGILLYRVRPIGYKDCDTKVFGDWSSQLTKGKIHQLSASDYLVINGFESDKNWQSSSTFIEGGKHADAITFYDGSYRPRQSIAVNKEANIGVVNTPVYDYSGRSTLTLAPFAVENNSLKYKTNVTEYPRASFDAPTTIGNPLDYTPQVNEISASQYYSSNNTFTHSHKDYIPSADNKPFFRTLLKNDGTKRIKEQGGIGSDFQIGSDKTMKYYYVKPSQYELDILFGNDVGYAEQYNKEIVVDANGQGTYTIKDSKGRMIVSGLYGDNPGTLDPLPTLLTASTETVELDISHQNFEHPNGISLNYNFDVATVTSPSDLKFSYELEFDHVNDLSEIKFQSSNYPGEYWVPRNFELELEILTPFNVPGIVSNYQQDYLTNNSLQPGSYSFQKDLRLVDQPATVVSNFENNQTLIDFGDFHVDYQVCECKEECFENYLKPGYWFVPVSQAGLYSYSSSGTLVAVNGQNYYIVKQADHTLLSAAEIVAQKPFLDESQNDHGDPNIFANHIIHCGYSCDFPSDEVFSGFESLVNQVYPNGDLWNLTATGVNANQFWYTTAGNIDIFQFIDENNVGFSLNSAMSGSNPTAKLDDFKTNKWNDNTFWEGYENQWFKVNNPYNDEHGINTPLVVPLTRAYFVKYVLLPKHPEFGFLNGLFTEEFTDFYKYMVNNTMFVPYSSSNLPSWLSGSSGYYSDYGFNDPLNLSQSVNFSSLPTHPSLTVNYPAGGIYNIEAVLQHFQGTNASIYDFMDGTTSSGPIKDKFHGTSSTQQGLFNYNLSKERFLEGVYNDLRTTKHVAQYLSNTAGPLLTGVDELIPGVSYNDLTNLSPVINAQYLWEFMDVDLIEGEIDNYLLENYTTSTSQEHIFASALKEWIVENVFLKTKSSLATSYFESATTIPTPIQDFIDQQSLLSHLVENKYNDILDDYMDGLTITYNSSTGLYTITTINNVTVSNFDINNAQPSLIGAQGIFADFSTYVNSQLHIGSIIANNQASLGGYQSILNTCSTYVYGLNANDLAAYFNDCFSFPVRHEAIRDDFVSDTYFLYHYYDNSSLVFDDAQGCPYLDYFSAYQPFEMEESLTDCYCTTIKEMALPHTGLNDIDLMTPGDITTSIAESILQELGFTSAQSTSLASSFITNLINPSTSGSCFNTQLSVNNLDQISNGLIYNLLCDPYDTELLITTSPCGPLTQAEVNSLNEDLYNTALEELVSEFEDWYALNKYKHLTEKVVYYFPQKQYQQTLYYYDQAGNLIKTVAPKKVTPNTTNTFLNNVLAYREDPSNAPSGFMHVFHAATTYTFNALNQLVEKNSPELSGPIYYHYDNTGRLIASQTPEQRQQSFSSHAMGNQSSNERFTYTLFDELGRIEENGVALGSFTNLSDDYDVFKNFVQSLERREVYIIHCDKPTPTNIVTLPFTQEFLRNRVSWSEYYPVHPSSSNLVNDDKYYKEAFSKQFYSYDVHGNVNHYYVQHKVSAVSSIAKYMTYTYDVISGNVKEFAYQPGQYDQFYHRYYYNEANRLVEVESSDDNVIWESDAKYFYYPHGPLARIELGDKQVQGIDYAYTLYGWLKSVNGASNDRYQDISQDGWTGIGSAMNRNAEFGQDELSYKIDYFNGDYKPIVSNPALEAYNGNNELYNGNITAIEYDISSLDPILYRYKYDQLHRLKKMESYQPGGNIMGYSSTLTYDPNGNIERLIRTGPTGTIMDDINYEYGGGNQLQAAIDDIDDPNVPEDYISTTGTGNASEEYYHYDKVGNEIYKYRVREYENHHSNRWFDNGKVKSTSYVASDQVNNFDNPWRLNFFYNGNGNRIAKVLKNANDGGWTMSTNNSSGDPLYLEQELEDRFDTEDQYEYTYYINDPTGNTIATYKHKFEDVNAQEYKLKEELDHINLYGSSRLGVLNRKEITQTWQITGSGNLFSNSTKLFDQSTVSITYLGATSVNVGILERDLGNKNYELTNHLGNVLATISDCKNRTDLGLTSGGFYKSHALAYSDYYPFGMQMPDRNFNIEIYRYGFQGEEKDDEIKGQGSSINYKYRMHDSRIARFFAVDPLAPSYPMLTPYQFSSNNPISLQEVEGLEGDFDKKFAIISAGKAAVEVLDDGGTKSQARKAFNRTLDMHNGFRKMPDVAGYAIAAVPLILVAAKTAPVWMPFALASTRKIAENLAIQASFSIILKGDLSGVDYADGALAITPPVVQWLVSPLIDYNGNGLSVYNANRIGLSTKYEKDKTSTLIDFGFGTISAGLGGMYSAATSYHRNFIKLQKGKIEYAKGNNLDPKYATTQSLGDLENDLVVAGEDWFTYCFKPWRFIMVGADKLFLGSKKIEIKEKYSQELIGPRRENGEF